MSDGSAKVADRGALGDLNLERAGGDAVLPERRSDIGNNGSGSELQREHPGFERVRQPATNVRVAGDRSGPTVSVQACNLVFSYLFGLDHRAVGLAEQHVQPAQPPLDGDFVGHDDPH